MSKIDKQIREILHCLCYISGTLDGREWNLETERYEDCVCVDQIIDIKQLILQVLRDIELPNSQDGTNRMFTPNLRGSAMASGYNQALSDVQQIIDKKIGELDE